jgi:type III pantothenate kinase
MLIALDIGNSSIKCGFFIKRALSVKEFATHPLLPSPHYEALILDYMREKNMDIKPEGIIISSVVQGHTEVLGKTLRRLFHVQPVIVDHTTNTGIRLNIPKPECLGPDRIANAVAAEALYKCPAAVIDFGTATTVSVVGRRADYIGGAILPGVRLMSEALARGTSRLSEIPVRSAVVALGTDTGSCVQSGLLYGTAGAVDRIITGIEKETGLRLKIVVTGGYSRIVAKHMKRGHKRIPRLTLQGLSLIYTRNRSA